VKLILIRNYLELCRYWQAGDERSNENYRDEILKWFDPFKKHKALSLLTEYTDRYQ